MTSANRLPLAACWRLLDGRPEWLNLKGASIFMATQTLFQEQWNLDARRILTITHREVDLHQKKLCSAGGTSVRLHAAQCYLDRRKFAREAHVA